MGLKINICGKGLWWRQSPWRQSLLVEIPVLTPGLLNPRTSLSVLSDRLRPEALYSGRGAARRWRLRHGVNTWWNINSRNLALSETAKLRNPVFDNKSDVWTINI